MNFLLHRHLAARDLGSNVAGLGGMLPDLWGMADRRVRARVLDAGGARGSQSSPSGDLLAGIQHHLAADRWFHADAVFEDGEREATERLRDAKMTARHPVLFAHVIWELCLDGELVHREGGARVMTAVRDGVRDAGTALAESASVHHFAHASRTSIDRLAFDRRLEGMCHALGHGSWILGYETGEGIAARVQGVRARVGLLPLGADDAGRLAEVARGLLARAALAVDRILATPSFLAM